MDWQETEIRGIPGRWRKDGFRSDYCEIRARWASHSGYLHAWIEPEESVEQTLRRIFRENAELPYLVGEEHRSEGWRTLSPIDGGWQIRLPDWSAPAIKVILEEGGFSETDPYNHFWAIGRDLPVSDIRLALAPLLEPGSRLADESWLADELGASLDRAGLLVEQLSLFPS